MNVFERIDTKILSLFTKFSHKIQIITGKTNFFLARLVIIIMGISVVFFVLNIFTPLSSTRADPLLGGLAGVFWIYAVSKDWNKLEQAENDSLSEVPAKTRFFIKGEDCFSRILWGFFSILFSRPLVNGILHPKIHWVIEIILHSFLFMITIYVYLTSVTPLPPGKSKVRQWLESFGQVLKPVPVRSRNHPPTQY